METVNTFGSVKVAAVNWKIRSVKTDGDFFGHMHDLINTAYEADAQLIVLPEFHSAELLGLAPNLAERKVPEFLSQFAYEIEQWIARICRGSGLIIIGGSYIKKVEDSYFNVCPIGHPMMGLTYQYKNKLTTYEKVPWQLSSGNGLNPSQENWLGSLICYDSEFPEASRVLAESGALVLAVPAFTETKHGFNRVRTSCRARAIENQVFVIHSSLVGKLDREPIPTTWGTSAIIAPSVEPFPESGVIVESKLNEEDIIYSVIDLDQLLQVRDSGDVRNWNDRSPDNWTLNQSRDAESEGS